MTHCIECGKPWGVLLDRGETPTPENLAAARAELVQMLLTEHWADDYEPDEVARVDTSKLPEVKPTEVVFIPESLNKFCDDNGICEPTMEGDCWQEFEWSDYPAWLLKGRKRCWALRWNCCDIGDPENYATGLSLVGASPDSELSQ